MDEIPIVPQKPDIWKLAASENIDALVAYIRDENIKGSESIVNRQDDEGNTGLHCAAKHGNLKCMEYLLFCKADRHKQNFVGWTPLHYAAAGGHLDCVFLLIDEPGSQRSIKDNIGMTPLHEAVAQNRFQCVQALVNEGKTPPGADRNAQSNFGTTALHIAAHLGYEHIVQFLIDSGANPNLRNLKGKRPMDAAKNKKIKMLLKRFTTPRRCCCCLCCKCCT